MHIYVSESLSYIPETKTTLQIKYTLIKKSKISTSSNTEMYSFYPFTLCYNAEDLLPPFFLFICLSRDLVYLISFFTGPTMLFISPCCSFSEAFR